MVAVAFSAIVWIGDRERDDSPLAASSDETVTTVEEASSDAPELAGPPHSETPAHSETNPLARRDPDDPMALGDVDAPVVIVEWIDMRCPFCARFSQETLPPLVERYIDSGLVRLEVREVVFFGDQSLEAAVAARAAGEQGLFHEFVDAVYAAAPDRGHADLPRPRLVEFAEEAGVPDLGQFETDLDRDDLRRAVEQSTTTASRLGVGSVPFFVVGNLAFAGAQSLDVFEQVIAAELGGAAVE